MSMKMLEEKVKKAVAVIYSLKEENRLFKERIEKISENIKFLEKENEKVRKIIKEKEAFNQERKDIKEKVLELLKKIERLKI